MKYIVDESVIIDYPEIFFDKSSINSYYTSRHIHHSRTYVSGYGRFHSIPKNHFIYSELISKNKIKLIGEFVSNVFARPSRKEIINSIISLIQNNKDFIVITNDIYLVKKLNELNHKSVNPAFLKKTLEIDYDLLNEFKSEELEFTNQQIDIATKVKLSLLFLLILTVVIIYFWEESQKILGGAIIIPIVLSLSLILFYLKKQWFKLYIILEFIFGLILCVMVYNFFEQKEFLILKKILAIASGIFILLRGLNNLDSYLLSKNDTENRFINFWLKMFHQKRNNNH
ncbi:hypothetical protein EZY14_001855 [Kordia sp. TARA_039_SRF]|nr:hypothetical protein EZY14_001855 [Kordia sp. TARA_039_SRF]